MLRNICNLIKTSYSDRDQNEGLFEQIVGIIKKGGLTEAEYKSIQKLFGIPVSGFDADKEILKSIDRIAVPIDIVVVPDLLKEKDYRLLDIEASSEYEHLLSPLINTSSLSVVKNKSKNAVITSVLQVF